MRLPIILRDDASWLHGVNYGSSRDIATRVEAAVLHIEAIEARIAELEADAVHAHEAAVSYRETLRGLETGNAALRARVAELEAALAWYSEQARLARIIHSEGDAGRQSLAADGGQRAREVLDGKQLQKEER